MKKIAMAIVIMTLTYNSFAVTVETTTNLNVYYPEYSKIDLVCGQMPKAAQNDVEFCCEAAFTGELLNEFKHLNIADNHICNGVMKKGYCCRALCQRGDDVFVIESQDKESFHDFAQALADMKVQNAIYLVGSIAYGWAKDQNGNRIEFGVESTGPTQQNRSYIVWR